MVLKVTEDREEYKILSELQTKFEDSFQARNFLDWLEKCSFSEKVWITSKKTIQNADT